jgi:hypothetical protein
MLEGHSPNWPPELADELLRYATMLKEYRENLRAAREGGGTSG